MNNKKLIKISMLLSISIIFSIIESFFPLFDGSIPGVKLGLANIIIVYTLYKYGFKDALYISIIRVLLIGLLRTGLFNITFFFSLSGAILSIIMMFIFKKITKLSIIGISIIGSLFHSIGQIICAIILLNTFNLIYYLPFILLFSVLTGIIVGSISKYLYDNTKLL